VVSQGPPQPQLTPALHCMTDYVRNEKVSHLRQGDYIILKGKLFVPHVVVHTNPNCVIMFNAGAPCRIVELHKSKTGKHGAIKVRIIGLDVFTQRKYEDWFPGSETVEVPEVKKYDLRIIDIIGTLTEL